MSHTLKVRSRKEISICWISLNMSCTLISVQVGSSTPHGSPMAFAVAYYIPQKEKLSCRLLNRLPQLHPLLNARAGVNCGLTTTRPVAVLLCPLQISNPEFSGCDHSIHSQCGTCSTDVPLVYSVEMPGSSHLWPLSLNSLVYGLIINKPKVHVRDVNNR